MIPKKKAKALPLWARRNPVWGREKGGCGTPDI